MDEFRKLQIKNWIFNKHQLELNGCPIIKPYVELTNIQTSNIYIHLDESHNGNKSEILIKIL